MDAFDFTAVPWLPPFRLNERVLLDGGLEVTHPPDALLPFAEIRPDPHTLRFVPHPPGEAARLAARDTDELRAMLAAVPAADHAAPVRERRWTLATALAAVEAGAALQRLGGLDAWRDAAARRRAWLLQAIDTGQPPPAEAVAQACRDVPHAFRHLGKALPTAEAVRLLAPLGRVCELGAGFGLFARAWERAGLLVAASDPDARAGTAFPVRAGYDAAASIAFFEAQGGAPPPLLMIWPQPDEGDWFAEAFARARPGQIVGLASPEAEFCWAGGLAAATPDSARAGGWRAALELRDRIAADYEAVGSAPVIAAGWPVQATPLRLWRRR